MENEELLLAMSEMMDRKIGPLENRMDSMETSLMDKMDLMETRLNDKIDLVEQRLDAKIDSVERELKGEIRVVDLKVHRINLKLENDIEPRLKEIEKCYTDTFRRYQYGVEKIEKLEVDNELIRSVLQKHHEVLKKQLA